MGIQYFEKQKIFKLDAGKASYIIGVVDEERFLGHVYFGRRLCDEGIPAESLMRLNERPFVPSGNDRDRITFYDSFPFEYPVWGIGDYRETCLEILDSGGHSACKLQYESHNIFKGKRPLDGLPATFGNEAECTTLEIVLRDSFLGLEAVLAYTAFEHLDVITRSVRLTNNGTKPIYLEKVLSCCTDLEGDNLDIISLQGAWGRERHVQRQPAGLGRQVFSSDRGESSHQCNPFVAVAASDATEDFGEVYGFNFVYSGNFYACCEKGQYETERVVMGINPAGFRWLLEPGQEFTAPEVVMVYSCEGIGGMTRTFHDLYRGHLIRGRYRDEKRPILINNWEATYFDFDTEKLLSIAREASSLGIEMLVMDDGWFGKRNNDECSLGDWVVNEEKLKGGIKHLVDEVNRLGMGFGIWFEPEMISPDSDLYREHPDWCIHVPGRTPALSRKQCVLDMTNPEVVETVYGMMKKILSEANITYVKWDMNRPLSDLGSNWLPAERQGEISHRYMLAVYGMMDRLTSDFPNILLESCSSGGARYDPGILYYSPQVWCSDVTDAIGRLEIQRGTAMVYPLSTMGAHVSDCPNHAVGRVTPFETRGYVALSGTFGYELDVTRIPEEDRKMIPEQVRLYHKYNDLIRRGDYYRLANYSENNIDDAWAVVSKDKSEVLVTYIQVLQRPNYRSRRLRLKGLDENAAYRDMETGETYSGGALMYAGINIAELHGDFKGKLIYLKA
jgi:alpha-galactosidase